MKKFMQFLKNVPKRVYVLVAAIIAAVVIPASLLAWGPSRDPYTIEEPADHVVFNSITNNPAIGDERNFVQIRDADSGNETYSDSISLEAGHEYVVFIYFHNNASSSLNADGTGIATGAYVKAAIPAVVTNGSTSTTGVGYVGAANADPSEVWDNITFSNTTGADISLRYVTGSAIIHSNGAVNGSVLSDSIITTGAAIGYDSLNGVVPGCNEYAGYVTFRIKAEQPDFSVSKQVRIKGTTTWSESVDAKIGDTVEYLITYKNTGTTTQSDVSITDELPEGLTYVEGSTYLANSNHPSGENVADGVASNGINIGDYAASAAAYIKFSAKVTTSSSDLDCGDNTLQNIVYVTTKNGEKSDVADVLVAKTCETPEEPELPHTGISETILSVLGLGAVATTTGYYIASRRALKR